MNELDRYWKYFSFCLAVGVPPAPLEEWRKASNLVNEKWGEMWREQMRFTR